MAAISTAIATVAAAGIGAAASRSASKRAAAATDRATDAANRTADLAEEQYSDWRTDFRPLQQDLVREARASGSQQEYDLAAERANADNTQAFGRAKSDLSSRLASYGVDPGSGKFSTSFTRLGLAEAAGGAGAQNMARQTVTDKSRAFKLDVSALGRNMPGTALAALNSASGQQVGLANLQAGNASREAAGYGAFANTAIRGLADWWNRPGSDPSDPATLGSGFTSNYNAANYG